MATQRPSVQTGAELRDQNRSSAPTNLSQGEEHYIDDKGVAWEKELLERETTNLTLPSYKKSNSLPFYTDEDAEQLYTVPAHTAKDLVTEVIHARDDPTLNAWTFRVWFLGEQAL